MRALPLNVLVGAAALLFATITSTGTPKAAVFKVVFGGEVDGVTAGLGPTFDTTQTLSGMYTFDSTVAARTGGTMVQATFDALLGLTATVGTYTATSTAALEIQVDDDPPDPNDFDRYGVNSRASDGLIGSDVNGLALVGFSFRLDDSSNSAITNALILPTALSLADFDSTGFFLFFESGELVNGRITSLSVSQVPIPAALPLMASGIGLMGLIGWRRRRKTQGATQHRD